MVHLHSMIKNTGHQRSRWQRSRADTRPLETQQAKLLRELLAHGASPKVIAVLLGGAVTASEVEQARKRHGSTTSKTGLRFGDEL